MSTNNKDPSLIVNGYSTKSSFCFNHNKNWTKWFNYKPSNLPCLKGDINRCKEIFSNKTWDYPSPTNKDESEFKEKKNIFRSRKSKTQIKFTEIVTEVGDEINWIQEKHAWKAYSPRNSMNRINIISTADALEAMQSKTTSTTEIMIVAFQTGLKSQVINPDNEFIFSHSKFHPFSFMTGHFKYGFDKEGRLLYPSPFFLDTNVWLAKPNWSKSEIWQGMEITDDCGWVLIDKTIKKKFRGWISDMVSQWIKAAFGHKITLNVKLFEPKSFLQRLTDYWSFYPKFIPVASDSQISPVERMKLIMAFALSGIYIPTKQWKPFNPWITETFQGEFDNETRTKVYWEQISNYPTISRFYVTDHNTTMSGYYDLSVESESFGSKITIVSKGYNCVDFKNINEKIIYIFPTARLLNASSENNRSVYITSCLVFNDYKNNLKGVIQFAKNEKVIHNIEGGVLHYAFTPKEINGLIDYDREQEMCGKFKFNHKDMVVTDRKKSEYKWLSKVTGSWLKQFIADDKVYWDIDTDVPGWIKPTKNCWPSDGRFREDLIWLYRSFYCSKTEEERVRYESLAQHWKWLVEKLQREEREMKAKKHLKNKK